MSTIPVAQAFNAEHILCAVLYCTSIVWGRKANHGLHVDTDRPGPVTRSMNTVGPEKPQKQAHDSRTRPRDRASASPFSKPKPKAKQQQKPQPRGWFTIRDIIDEKTEDGRTLYLIDWDGADQSGRRYDPTWVCSYAVTFGLVLDSRLTVV